MGAAWERHAMCESDLTILQTKRSNACLMGDCTTKSGVGKFNKYTNSMQQVFDNLEVTQTVNNFPDTYEV